MLKAYIFDVVGTLVDFQWNLEAGVKGARAKLEEMGFDRQKLMSTDSYAKLYNDAIIDALMRRVAVTSSEVREKIGEVFDFWDADAASRWKLRENARETLDSLHRESTVGLVTSLGRKAILQLLQDYDMEDLFHVVVTRNDTTLIKPYDEGLRLTLTILGISPEEMLFIGDSDKDVAAAKGIGAKSAFLVGGEQELTPEIKPDYILNSLSDLLKIK